MLAQQCFACHTNSKSGGLRLDSREDMLAGGKSGAGRRAGRSRPEPAHRGAAGTAARCKMPKGGTRLTDEQIGYFATWVKDGAYWPVDKVVDEGIHRRAEAPLVDAAAAGARTVPAVKDAAWPVNDIDRFVLARLEKEGLKPTTTADRRTLLRRVTYDLTGLMPTYEEVQAFENDKSPNAWEKVVDRLLASPHYGERWARHWMDVVRYGEDDYNVGGRPGSRREVSVRLPLSRLADPRAQRRHALRHVREGAARRRPADREDPRQAHPGARHERQRHLGVPGQPGADRARRRVARQGGRDEQGVPGPDRRLRALPRPQVRRHLPRRTTTGWRASSRARNFKSYPQVPKAVVDA